MTTFDIPAFAGLTVELSCPWPERVQVIVDRGATVYGPSWNPGVLECLQRMSDTCRDGYTVAGYDHLLRAEAKLGIKPPVAA